MADNFKPAQLQKLSLAGSGCSASATSITLQSLTLPDGSTMVAMTDLGSIAYGTLEPGTSKEEQISFTGITQNADGTATLTGVTRGLGFISPYTTVSANQKAHAGGAVFVLSNTAGFYDKILIKDNDETVTGTFTFSTVPTVSSDPVSGSDVARRSWVLTVVNGGAVSTDKIVVTATAGETLVAGNLVYLKSADGYWWKTDADTAATVEGVILGIAQGAGSAAGSISGGVLLAGTDTNQSGMTIGATQYASNTAGAISASAGTTSKKIGVSRTATNLYFDPNFGSLPTAAQIAALAGNNGTPSSTNKFVTQTGFQNGAEVYAADAGANDTYVVTLSPVPSAYTTGMVVRFKANTANTGAATLNVNALGAKTIKKESTRDLSTGDIIASQIVSVIYDGTNFQMLSGRSGVQYKIYSTTTAAGTSGTSETDLLTTTIPGGLLGTSGVIAFKIFVNGTVRQDLTVRVYYGASSCFTATFTGGTADNVGNGWIDGNIIASGATNTQESSVALFFCENGSEGLSGSTTVALAKFYTASNNSAMAIDSTADQTFKVTGQYASTTGSPSFEVYTGVITYLG